MAGQQRTSATPGRQSVKVLLPVLLAFPLSGIAAELSFKGMADLRLSHTDAEDSYVNGGIGKFRYNEGSQLSVAQAAISAKVDWNENLSLTAVGNGFADGVEDAFGLTELYLKYRSLPSENGLRHTIRAGAFYPAISLENTGTAWSTTRTLTPSTLNSWIGEEIRLQGIEYQLENLGKFNQRDYDLRFRSALFWNNDTAGALLAWHGWTQSSRQTLLHEKLVLPDFPARQGDLAEQAALSDPFHEEDDRAGFMLSLEAHWPRKGMVQLGYYDNRGQPYTVDEGNYGWDTRFLFSGFQYRLSPSWQISGQLMSGDTLMQSPLRQDVVNNRFDSAYLMLSWRKGSHLLTGRAEAFQVDDRDNTVGDNNNEEGYGATLSYRYRYNKQWFLFAEYNYLNSDRAARQYTNIDTEQTEQQLQFGSRYYF